MGSKRSASTDGNEEASPASRRQRVEEEEAEAEEEQQEEEAPTNNEHHNQNSTTCSGNSPMGQRHLNTKGKPPEAGIITKVEVENFMCHRKMTVKLCSNVNFIHGQNGSGKSAILAAVQICLGAGARRTHRARNLKELIRKEAGENCNGAKVRVTILNKGEDAFEHGTYGDFITVERTITKGSGYNGYKLLDQNAKEQSRSKKDLDNMLDHLNIQVENPVAVLDQEEAKKFLTGKPEDKYKFFVKATELERIDRSYAAVQDNVLALSDTKEKVRESMQGSIDNVRRLEKEYQQFQALHELETKLQDARVSYGWAYYQECEAQAKGAEEALEQARAKHDKRTQELTQLESLTNGPDDEEARRKEVMEQLIEEAREAADRKKELESELKRAKAPVKAKERELAGLAREQKSAEHNLQSAKQELADEREKIAQATGSAASEEARREQRLQANQAQLEELLIQDQEIRQAMSENLQAYEEAEPQVDHAKANVDRVQSQMNALAHKIRELESSSDSDSVAMFGNKCVRLHKAVEQARSKRRFKGKVVGPVGAYIKIVSGKEKFASIAELAMGPRNLDRFIVTNDHDRQILMRLRREVGCQNSDCGVWQTSDGARFKVPPPPADSIETVASCLNISDDLVFNSLVDQARIDTRALAESKESSERTLLVRGGQGRLSLRGNVKEVFFLPQGDHWKLQNGSPMLISNEKPLKQTIGADVSATLQATKRERQELDTQRKELGDHFKKVSMERKEHQKRWNYQKGQQRKNAAKMEQLEAENNNLKAEREEAANFNVDTTDFEEEVEGAKLVVQTIQEKRAEVEKEINALAPAVGDVNAQLEEVTARNERVLSDMRAAEESLEEYMQSLTQQLERVKKKRGKVEQLEELMQLQETQVDKFRQDSLEALQKARLLHFKRDVAKKRKEQENDDEDGPPSQDSTEEEPTDEELEAIESEAPHKDSSFYRAKAERAKKRLQEEKQRRAVQETDEAVAYEKYKRAQKNLDDKIKQIDAIESNVDVLCEDLKRRRKLWKRFQTHISQMTNETFDEILNTKGSSGTLEFDHKEGTLDLIVQKDNTQESSQTKDVKALSGGERSFTTLSLLLALGERLETPFRVMDEFDVFLDPVSRKIALDLLVSTAQEMTHRQFIFITPQDVSSLTPGPLLKIHKMKPPERSGLVGGPTQQSLEFSQRSA